MTGEDRLRQFWDFDDLDLSERRFGEQLERAAHMAALAAPDDQDFRAWTTRGIELGEREPTAAYWRGPLLNNLGWRLHEQGVYDEALSVFERALTIREETQPNDHATEIARHA